MILSYRVSYHQEKSKMGEFQNKSLAKLKSIELSTASPVSILSIFSHVESEFGAMLLDSSDGQHENGQYHIMVASPLCFVEARQREISIRKADTVTTIEGDPFKTLRLLQHEYPLAYQAPTEHTLPFACGYLGYFGYDLGRTQEKLPEKNSQEYVTPDMAVGLYTWSIVEDKSTGKLYFQWHPDYPHPSLEIVTQWLSSPAKSQQDFQLTGHWTSNLSQSEYNKRIANIHEYLHAGDCYQVNLAQRFTTSYIGSEWQAYTSLREANNAPFSAFIRLKNSAILSISPERFISVTDNIVQTKPIKGTMPRSEDPAIDQLNAEQLSLSEKDRAENLMIVDLLRNDLSRSCTSGSIKVPKLFNIESFPAVHHLVSTIEGVMANNQDCLSVVAQAFPGGSITGAPKIRAMEIIEELEPNRRNIYCGSIGYIDANGHMDTNICIRTVLCEQQMMHCWAGGGIVLDSDSDSEYQESLDKVAKILPVLSQANRT